VSVLKLEREQGLRFRIVQVGGRTTADLEYLRDLTLTDKTRVFKTSLFSAATDGGLQGRVSDDQRGHDTAGVAGFFLSDFLGCRLRDSPEKSTLAFVRAVTEFINSDVDSPERRGQYQVALLASMQDQTTSLRPRTFASSHVETQDRPALLRRIREQDLDPDSAFPKDTTLVRVAGFKMTFSSGMVLVGSADDLRERVAMPKAASPGATVRVKDAIRSLEGR
jgi:hypothetical protein